MLKIVWSNNVVKVKREKKRTAPALALAIIYRRVPVEDLEPEDGDRRFLSEPERFFLRFAFSRSAAASCATLKACWARACAWT